MSIDAPLLFDEDDPSIEGDLITVTLDPSDQGQRLDRALMAYLPQLSRARLQSLIDKGCLSLEGTTLTDGKHKARAGQYELIVPALIDAAPLAQDLSLDILFEDEDLIVINKPAGMAAHPAPGTPDGTLVNALLFHCAGQLSGIGGVARPGIVHRLDKETSGIMVAAKSDRAHQGLSALFSRHDISRQYLALVRGVLKTEQGTITTQIGRSHHDRKKMAVLRQGGREAITHYEVLGLFGKASRPCASLVQCRLETGRTHQIRVHMAHLGAPCLGDPIYGSGAPVIAVQTILKTLRFERQALHAAHLGFVHPVTGKKIAFKTEPPDDMQALIEALSLITEE